MSNSDKVSQKKYIKLKESEEKFRKISSNALDAIIQIDDHGVISYWNKAAEKIFGYSENEVLGKNLHSLIASKHYHKSFLKGMELFRKTGKGRVIGKTLEIKGIRKDGTEFPVELSISSIRVNKNWNALAFIRDITERKQAEEKYIAIFEHSPIAIELYDSDGLLRKVNKACLDLFGIVNIKEIEEFKLFDDPNIPENEKDLLKEGKTIRYEGEFDFNKVKQLNLYRTTKSGVIYLDVVITPLYIRDKREINNYLVQIQDITERKLTERKLKEYSRNLENKVERRTEKIQKEMEKAKMYLDIAAAIILVLNSDGLIELVNKKGCEILGYDEEQLIGKNWFNNFILKEDKEDLKSVFRKLMAGEMEPFEYYENSILTKEDEIKLLAWSNTFLKDEQGNIIGTISSGKDITERKKAEKELLLERDNFLNILNSMEDGVYIVDQNYNIEYVNPILIKEFGRYEGKKCYDYFDDREEVCPWCKNQEVFKGETVRWEWYSAKNQKTYDLVDTPLKNADGSVSKLEIFRDITASKKTEQKLKEQNWFLNNVIESLTHPFFVVNVKDYTISLANTAGRSDGNSQKSFCYNLNHNRDKPCGDEIKCLLREVVRTKKEVKVEHTHYNQRGETRIYDVHGYPIFDKNDEVIQMIEYSLDITERKKKEEEIRLQSEIIENMSEGVYLIKLDDGSIVYTNPTFEEMFGYNPGEMIGKNVVIVNAPTDKTPEETKNEIVRILKNTGEWHGEIINIKKDGTPFWCYANVSLFDHPNHGKVIISMHTDITERKKVEDVIRDSEAKFRGVFESKLIGTLFWNAEGEITDANKAFLDMVGYTKDEVLNGIVSWKDMTPPEYLERDEKLLKELATNGYISPIEKEYYHKDGHRIPIILGASTLPRSTVSGVAFVLDITERKKAETELKKAIKDLKTSNNELEQFAYVASHDLQEPLRMVASFTQLLQDRYKDKLDEVAHDFINYAVDGATRMQSLITDLLIFSRVGSRGKPFKITDMNVVIENVLNNLRQLVKETHCMITYDPLPVIEADEFQMIQLFQNLISNGIKFRSEIDPMIHVTAEIKADMWIFTVKDNGIGIENKFFDRIFIIFQRLHKKSEYGGTGIGLAVCKKIVQQHGGKIWVDSEFGKGSSFHFTIKKRKQERNSVLYK